MDIRYNYIFLTYCSFCKCSQANFCATHPPPSPPQPECFFTWKISHIFDKFPLFLAYYQLLRIKTSPRIVCPCQRFFSSVFRETRFKIYTLINYWRYSFIPFNLGHTVWKELKKVLLFCYLSHGTSLVLGPERERERDHMISPFSSRNNKCHIHIF